MNRILLVKTSSLGDVIHNLPVIADIRVHYPNVKIDWLVEESFADIPRLHPEISQIIPVAIRRWRKNLFSKKTWCEIAAFKRLVSTQHYDLIIDTQGLIKSAVMTKFAHGIKCGLAKDSAREPFASYFYDKKYSVARNQHAVVRNRELVAHALNVKKSTSAPDYGIKSHGIQANSEIKDLDLAQPYIIGLHGTSRDSKLWPISHWISLGKSLKQKNLSLVLPWASEAEQQRANQIAATLDNATVLPKFSIAQLANVISKAHSAIGVDTGLSHLSVALDIPTVAIYTDTNPALTGVMPSAKVQVVNLGGIKQTPSVTEVVDATQQVTSLK